MSGNRSDQHHGDSGKAGSNDYNQRGEERIVDEHIAEEDKRHLQSNPRNQPMVPEEGVNPAARDLGERKEKARRQGEGGMSADERVDEASEESFPASDPPSQP